MKKKICIYSTVLFLTTILMSACGNNSKPSTTAVEPKAEQLILKGEYLVTIMGCNDCHSPKRPGPQGPEVIAETMLSGYPADRPFMKIDPGPVKNGWSMLNEDFTAAAGMWGVSFAANITSDQTGIGNWTEENFRRALKQGRYKGLEGSRMLLPPMPWTNFIKLTDEDAQAIFIYLKNTRPVKNVAPEPIGPVEIK